MKVRFLTLSEAAERVNVEPDTISQWIHRGRLEVIDLRQFGGRGKRVAEPALIQAEAAIRRRDRTGKARQRIV